MTMLKKLMNLVRNAICAAIWVALDAKDVVADWFFEPLRTRRQIRCWWLNRSAKLKSQGYSIKDARRLFTESQDAMRRESAERRRSANADASGV